MPTNPHQHAFGSSDDDGCPVCGDADVNVLSPIELKTVLAAIRFGTPNATMEMTTHATNAVISGRLANRTLDLVLAGRVVPIGVDESGEVSWRSVEEHFNSKTLSGFEAEIAQFCGDQNAADDEREVVLSETDRAKLRLATVAGWGPHPPVQQDVNTVIEWAETIRDIERDLRAVLAGELLLVIPASPSEEFWGRDVACLPAVERRRYRWVLANLIPETN